MPDEIKVEVKGLDELQADFASLARQCNPKALQPILKRVIAPFATKLLPLTPQGPTGNLRKGVQTWSPKITSRRPDAMARSGIRYRVAPHAGIVEYGTVERYTKPGAFRGISPARHFISPLMNQEEPGILHNAIEAIWDAIEKQWGKPSSRSLNP